MNDPRELKGDLEQPRCVVCGNPVRVFYGQGLRGVEATPFITTQITPCSYCAETERIVGARDALTWQAERRRGA